MNGCHFNVKERCINSLSYCFNTGNVAGKSKQKRKKENHFQKHRLAREKHMIFRLVKFSSVYFKMY